VLRDFNLAYVCWGSFTTGVEPAADPAMSAVPPKAEVKSEYWHLPLDGAAPHKIQAPKPESRIMRYETHRPRMGRHRAHAAEQAARRSTGERPSRSQWHLLGVAIWCTLARSARQFRSPTPTCYSRFVRWRRAGVWSRIMNALAMTHDTAVQMIDTSIVRVHQHGACITRNRTTIHGSVTRRLDQQDSCSGRYQRPAGSARPDGWRSARQSACR